MLLSYLIVLLFVLSQANLHCTNIYCKTCTKFYNYRNISCLEYCPTGYKLNGTYCQPSGDDILFSINFMSYRKFNTNSIEYFSHPNKYNFNNLTKVTPVVTIDRGFYFFSSSFLVSNTSWILAPDFCIGIFLKVITPGLILQIKDNFNNYFSLSYGASFEIDYLYWNSTDMFHQKHNFAGYFQNWLMIHFRIVQYQGSIYVSAHEVYSFFHQREFRMDSNQSLVWIGDSNNLSFQGFISHISIKNSKECSYKINLIVPCDINRYYFNKSCVLNTNQCPENLLQTRASCNICYSLIIIF